MHQTLSSRPAVPECCQKIILFGPSGVGKTSLAHRLSAEWELKYIDIDWLFTSSMRSLQPERPLADSLAVLLEGDRWIIDGSYEEVQSLTWSKATLLIWLDFSLPVVAWRMMKRVTFRVWRARSEFHGKDRKRGGKNPQVMITSAASRLWTHRARRRRHFEELYSLRTPNLCVLRLRTPAEVDSWRDMMKRPGACLQLSVPPFGT